MCSTSASASAAARSLARLLVELEVTAEAEGLAGKRVAEAFQDSEARLVAIVHADGDLTMAPGGPTVLRAGDRLMLYGSEQVIEDLAASAAAPRATSSVLE